MYRSRMSGTIRAQPWIQDDEAVWARKEVEHTQVAMQQLAEATHQRHAAIEERINKLIAQQKALFSQAEVTGQQLAEAADRRYAVSQVRMMELTYQVEALTSQAKVEAQKISKVQAQTRAQADKAERAREEVEPRFKHWRWLCMTEDRRRTAK
jgi:hypothetical protein